MQEKLYTDPLIDVFLSTAADWKRKADQLSHIFMYDKALIPRGEKIRKCGSWIVFEENVSEECPPKAGGETSPAFRLAGANFCRLRLCPVCQWRRSRSISGKLSDVWDRLKEDGFDVLHLVLTVRNVSGDDLRDQIGTLFRSFTAFRKEPALAGWKGALRFLEVSYNEKEDSYHPHLHVLLAVKPSYFKSRYYVSRDKIVTLWRAALGVDYDPQVYISKCDPAAIREVSKYCVKPFCFDDVSEDVTRSIYRTFDVALHSRRLIQSYGVFKQVIRECKIPDDFDQIDDDQIDDAGEQNDVAASKRIYHYDPVSQFYELI